MVVGSSVSSHYSTVATTQVSTTAAPTNQDLVSPSSQLLLLRSSTAASSPLSPSPSPYGTKILPSQSSQPVFLQSSTVASSSLSLLPSPSTIFISTPALHPSLPQQTQSPSMVDGRSVASHYRDNSTTQVPSTAAPTDQVPSVSPSNLDLIVYSSTRISLVWDDIKPNQANGILLGYNVSLTWRDKIDNQKQRSSRTVLPTGNSVMITLDDLQKYTKYTFKVCGFTSKGCGPWSQEVTGYTNGDVPSQPPSNITYSNFTSTSSVKIQWSPIPSGHVNSILLGYKVTYKLIMQSEINVEETGPVLLSLGPKNLSLELHNLQAHSIYKIEIAGVTDAGVGKAQTIFAETCRCPKTLYTNYWINPPYSSQNTSTGVIGGIFPNIVIEMVTWACGVCTNGHGDTIVDMRSNGRGMTSLKDSVVEVINDMDEVPQVSFPIYGNKDIQEYKGSHQYVHVVDSPGIAFITVRKHLKSFVVTKAMMDCLVLIGFTICMTYISGFIFWLLDFRKSDERMPSGFLKGTHEGFWLSFTSMTTVGYGDRIPLSKFGRLFGICWTLIGLIVISMLTSALSTSFNTICMGTNENELYGNKIGAINNSIEYQTGTLRNAKIKKENLYSSVYDIHDALLKGDVRGALIDTYVAADQKHRLFDENIRVKKLLDKKIGYGVVLSGDAKVIRKRCNDFMIKHMEEISRVIQNYTSTIEPSVESEASERSRELLRSDSTAFKKALLWLAMGLLLALIGGLTWHVMFLSRQRKHKVNIAARMKSRQAMDEMEDEMRKLVDIYYRDFKAKMNDLKIKHRREISQLIKENKIEKQCSLVCKKLTRKRC